MSPEVTFVAQITRVPLAAFLVIKKSSGGASGISCSAKGLKAGCDARAFSMPCIPANT